jgi:hypothetical protein
MTETPQDRPEQSNEPAPAAQPTAETAAQPTQPPGAPPVAAPSVNPLNPANQPQAAYYPPPPYPFAPVVRAPREPWVNPSKRVAVSVIAVFAALVLLFVGAVVGHAATRHHDRVDDRGFTRYGPAPRDLDPGFTGRLPNQQRPRIAPTRVPGGSASPAQPSASATS